MNKKSLALLSCLRDNSREKLTAISKKTKIPVSTLFDLLKELNEVTITKNTVLINFSELGYHTRAHIFLKVAADQKENLKKHICFHDNINSIYKVNNGWDFVIETVHQNIKELDCFLEDLNKRFKIEERQIHYLIDDIKREGFFCSS